MNWRRRAYDGIIRGYVYDFAVKQGYLEKSDCLSRDCMMHGFVELGDMYYDVSDIMYDIDNRIPAGRIIEWYDYNLEMLMNGYNSINYESYLRGARHRKRSWVKETTYKAKLKIKWMFRKRMKPSEKKRMKERFLKVYNFSELGAG